MRLNWFSPLRPSRSAIAEYSAMLVPYLAARVDLDLWTDQASLDNEPAGGARLRRYQPGREPWEVLNRAAMSVYHIGNQVRFHRRIWQLSVAHPGVVVLHDHRLQHLFAAPFDDAPAEAEDYLALVERHHGKRGRADAESTRKGLLPIDLMAVRYPLTAAAVEHALGVLVHSAMAKDALAEVACPVTLAALPYPATAAWPEPWPRRPAIPPLRLVVFGLLGPNRRLEVLLEALARFPRRREVRLDVYGDLMEAHAFEALRDRLGLADLVRVHGFVSEAVLDRALAASHLAVNLRYPTMGEASYSQLRVWDHALPSLVTRVGWYAELPEDTVAWVRPEHEVEDLLAHLHALLDQPGRLARMGENGRRRLQQVHQPAAYVEALLELVERARRHRKTAAFSRLALRAAALLGPLATAPGRAPLADLDPRVQAVERHRERITRQCFEAAGRWRR